MRWLDFVRGQSGLLAAFAVMVLAACTVVVDDGPSRPPRPDGPAACTREYAPVCAQRGNERRTFGNACVARSEGFGIVHQGECRRADDRPPQAACTFEYRPVCAQRGNDRRTFGNACQARVEGYNVIREGECRAGGGGSGAGGGGGGRPPERACTREYDPVCGRRGRDYQTFGNACMAEEADFQIVRRGTC